MIRLDDGSYLPWRDMDEDDQARSDICGVDWLIEEPILITLAEEYVSGIKGLEENPLRARAES